MNYLSLLFLMLVLLTSCTKEKEIYPEVIQKQNSISFTNLIGKEYLLDSGVVYFENQATGSKKYYTHFDTYQLKSVLDPFYGAVIPFDSLIRNKTKWKFLPGYQFQLNDSLVYKYQPYMNINRVYGLENGSSRPIEILHLDENSLVVKVFESFVTMNQVDYRFYSVLQFRQMGTNTKKMLYQSEYNAPFSGTLPLPKQVLNDLTGTRWVIYKYVKKLSTITCSDTLFFKTKKDYTLNNSAVRPYSLQYILGTGMYSFSLYYCYTLGGSYVGQILPSFIQDGQINALTMNNLYTTDQVTVWMKKI